MNEKQTIKKLQLLKTIQPEQVMLDDIKKGVYQKLGMRSEHAANRLQKFFATMSLSVKVYLSFSIGIIAVILFLGIFLFQTQLNELILYSKIAFAGNRYEKAQMALSDITKRYNNRESLTKNTANEWSQELAFTNQQMDGLMLKGEQGKYTQQQCHELYQQYLSYLKQENAIIPNQQDLKSQVSSYQEHAEKKLHKYPHL